MDHQHRRQGFTLFEIAISLSLVALAVVTVLALFPAGIKAQEQARLRIYASAKILEMMDMFNSPNDDNSSMDNEAMEPWDTPIAYRSRACDLESMLPSHRSGIAPLPLDIARRLDSDGDEISSIIDGGGYLYYSQPQVVGNFEDAVRPTEPNTEAQKLVFGVVGYAQENQIYSLPQKAWPYYNWYPSPPYVIPQELSPNFFGNPPTPPVWVNPTGPSLAGENWYFWEAMADPDVAVVMRWPEPSDPDPTKNFGYLPYVMPGGTFALTDEQTAVRYVQAVLWYCDKKNLPPSFYQPTTVIAKCQTGIQATPAEQIRAMRFLSHALTCLTTWVDKSKLDLGYQIPSVMINGKNTPTATFTHQIIVNCHESCLRMVDQFVSENPYDWSVQRPLDRATMMDVPLLQWDITSSPHTGNIFVAGGDTPPAAQWKPIAASPLTNIGPSYAFPGVPIPQYVPGATNDAFWGNDSHFSLTAPFSADERCRQVVFWSVDWQSYVDFETCPSAPVDGSRYLFGARRDQNQTLAERMLPYLDPVTQAVNSEGACEWVDNEIWNYRNPELTMLFIQDVSAMSTGSDVSAIEMGKQPNTVDAGNVAENDHGSTVQTMSIFNGLYGADRNYNGRLDRGPLPKSARLHATVVARFNYYDPRIHMSLR